MRYRKLSALMLLIAVSLLAGCQTTVKSSCAINRPPPANDPVRLAIEERQISNYLIAVDRYGRNQGCWE